MTNTLKLFGLIGFPLAQSFSKKYFTEKFQKEGITNCVYENFPLQNIDELTALLSSQPDLHGLNVTIPYKQSVLAYLDDSDEIVKETGAANCIKLENGRKKGFNTDVYGFMNSIQRVIQPVHTSALILGQGGSANAVAFGLKQMGIDYKFVTRNPKEDALNFSQLTPEIIGEYKIIVNATPAGMMPNRNSFPAIPFEALTSSHLLFDLIYNPEETLFLRKGKEYGAAIKNGMEMLQLQAEKSWEIWNS